MNQKIHVLEATLSDLDIMVQNNLALARETEDLNLNEPVVRLGVEQALSRKECHYFVATMGEKVIGQTMITYEWSDWRNGLIWWIQSVYVLPEYRKQGAFRSLYQHIEKLARAHPEVKALRLYVMKDNQTGKNTYQSLGMDDSGYVVYEKENLT